jgi:hypothetical protein
VALEPLVGIEPVQPPDAVQVLAFVEDQVSVELPPRATLPGLALNDTLGTPADAVTVAVCDVVPPLPVQVKM